MTALNGFLTTTTPRPRSKIFALPLNFFSILGISKADLAFHFFLYLPTLPRLLGSDFIWFKSKSAGGRIVENLAMWDNDN